MTNYDQNLDTKLAQVFKGVLRLIVSTDTYAFVELQEFETNWKVATEKHFTHAGKKKVNIAGDDSRFRMKIKETADMYSVTDPNPPAPATGGAGPLTISYLLDQMITKRILPTLQFDGVNVTESTDPETAHHKFTAVIDTVNKIRPEGGATHDIEIEGEILTHDLSQLLSS